MFRCLRATNVSRTISVASRTSSSAHLRCLHTSQPTVIRKLQPTSITFRTQKRRHSAAPTGDEFKVYSFDEVKKLADAPEENTVIIGTPNNRQDKRFVSLAVILTIWTDVREPHEFQGGYIPGAINIPVSSQPDALFLSEEDFLDRFGFEKPDAQKEAVFYCKAGVRSSAAAQIARQAGYGRVVEYRGSWNDWLGKGGKVERP